MLSIFEIRTYAKKSIKIFLLFCLGFLYYKKAFYTTKMDIFIAFRISIKISHSSKDKKMAQGNMKISFFKKYRFCYFFSFLVTKFAFFEKIQFYISLRLTYKKYTLQVLCTVFCLKLRYMNTFLYKSGFLSDVSCCHLM